MYMMDACQSVQSLVPWRCFPRTLRCLSAVRLLGAPSSPRSTVCIREIRKDGQVVRLQPCELPAPRLFSRRPRRGAEEGSNSPPVVAAHHVLPLSRQLLSKPGLTLGSKFRNFGAFAGAAEPQPAGLDIALPASRQTEYLLNVEVEGTNYSLIIDSGSSDTWFVKSGFQCYDSARRPVPLAECAFGPEFKGGFPEGAIQDQHFNVSYGNSANGPNLNGDYGYAALTLAGVTVPKQQIALATSGYWTGDNISTGILGLGMPGLTEAYVASDPMIDPASDTVSYSSVITTMSSELRIPALFSLGLSRTPDDSFLALGGVPANIKTGEYTTTPLLTVGPTPEPSVEHA